MKETDNKVNRFVSLVLKVSSGISMIFMAAGLVLFFISAGPGPYQYARVTRFSEVLTGVLQLEPLALMTMGIIILLSTPFLRVLGAFFSFWFFERDKVYALIALGVLGILMTSLLVPGIR